MITNCYIKGRFDYGVGKCAVVIVDDTKRDEEQKVLHQVAWKVPEQWDYKGEMIVTDQYNCEILAATYALQWCILHHKPLVNLYFNTTTCQKWYLRGEFPENRKPSAQMYLDAKQGYIDALNEHDGAQVIDRIYVEFIKKDDKNVWNWLVNDIALNVK